MQRVRAWPALEQRERGGQRQHSRCEAVELPTPGYPHAAELLPPAGPHVCAQERILALLFYVQTALLMSWTACQTQPSDWL